MTFFPNDILSITGWIIGLAGLIFAIWQLYKTKSAFLAAEEARRIATGRNLAVFTSILSTLAHRSFVELKSYVRDKRWSLASIKSDDLAQLIYLRNVANENDTELVRKLRDFSILFSKLDIDEKAKFSENKYNTLIKDLAEVLDKHFSLTAIKEQ